MGINCDLSEESLNKILFYLKCFQSEIDENQAIQEHEKESLISSFKICLSKRIAISWTDFIGKRFSALMDLTGEQERIVEAMKWAALFFQGMQFFAEWQNRPLTNFLVAEFLPRTLSAYEYESLQKIERRIMDLSHRMERQQSVFSSFLHKIHEPAENILHAFGFVELENALRNFSMQNSLTNALQNLFGPSSVVEQGKKFLLEVVWKEYALQTCKASNSGTRHRLFFDPTQKV